MRGLGATPDQAFEQAGIALTAVITDPARVSPREMVALSCAAPNLELLLADWLNGLIFEMATRHMLFGKFDVSIRENRLEGKAWGEPLDAARHRPAVEIKGATYTELKVAQREDGSWLAQCVVDV